MQNKSLRYVTRSNIEHFRRKIDQETDPNRRELLIMLLDEERKKLAAMSDTATTDSG